MNLVLLWVFFIVLGIALIIFEAVPVLDIPGVAMLVVGCIGLGWGDWLLSEPWHAVLIAMVVAVLTTVIMVPVYRRLGRGGPSKVTTGGDSLVGQKGTVTHKVVPNSLSGKVRVGNRSWSAEAEEEIPAGTKVEVVGSEGVHVIVRLVPARGSRERK
jgi:hypothetical protein